jgi:hypothetical protein
MRGLMAKPSGEIIERPILSNFREGLSVLEYFISTHGARKGLADTALKTADSGYLTRKLVDVAQDVIIVEQDCNTLNGIEIKPILEGDEELVPLAARILGRTAMDDIRDPGTREIIVAAGQEIDEKARDRIDEAKHRVASASARADLRVAQGCCAKCYGRNLATSNRSRLGESVGIIAAQSIGEPGTQLTMRTFHIGGTASSVFKQPQIIAKHDGVVRYQDLRTVQTAGRHLHRAEQERRHRHPTTRMAASWRSTRWSSAPPSRWKTAARSRRARVRQVGPLQRADSVRASRRDRVPRLHRRRDREEGSRRVHRPGRHRGAGAQGRPAPADHHEGSRHQAGVELLLHPRRARTSW